MTHLPALTSNRLRPRQTHSHLLTFRGFAAADSSATYSITVLRGRSASKGYLPTLAGALRRNRARSVAGQRVTVAAKAGESAGPGRMYQIGDKTAARSHA